MTVTAMIQHFHGGTSLITVPVGRNVRQTLDDIWTGLNDESPAEGDFIVNSGQPGDLITFIGHCPFMQRHAVVESEGFTTFMTTTFAIKHVADRTAIIDGVRIYDPNHSLVGITTTGSDGPDDESDVFDPSAENHVLPSDLVASTPLCESCGDREALIHESGKGFCPTCYEAGAGDDL